MTRKCRICNTEIPTASKSQTDYHKLKCCSKDCAVEYRTQKALKALERKKAADRRKAQDQAKRQRQERRAPKENDKSHQEQLTQTEFNKMIRLLDDGLPCISCGRHQCGGLWDAGHKRSVGSSPETRFDPRNCHRQGSACNRANRRPDKLQRRNAETIAQEYDQRLRERYGDELVDWVNGPHPMPHFNVDELKALRKVFSAECRRLERGEGPSRDWRALDYSLRDLIGR